MSAPSVSVKMITKVFREGRNKSVHALRGVSFSIKKGEILCLLGPNGSGKTTTLKIVCGLVEPDSGEVEICGRSILGNLSVLKEIGVVLEGSRNVYPYLSAYENIKYYSRMHGFDGHAMYDRANELLKYFGIFDRKDTSVAKLSLGTQQKVALCCALAPDPAILLLDEPTSGLDVITKRELMKAIDRMRMNGKSILLMTHQMDVAERLADRVAILDKGEILIENTPKALSRCLETREYRITLHEDPGKIPKDILVKYDSVSDGSDLIVRNAEQGDILDLLHELSQSDFHILSISKNLTLEESFVRFIRGNEV